MAHRLFPGLCALWFGALFALGSMAASAEALGALVVHLHLPAILPAAAPPLGFTARVLLTLMLGLLGAGFGLAIGLMLHRRADGAAATHSQASGPPATRAATRAAARAARARDESQDSMADDIAPAAPSQPASSQIAAMQAGAPRVRSRDAHPDAPPRRPLVATEDVLPYAATSAFSTPDPVAPASFVPESLVPESFVRPTATTPLYQAVNDLGGDPDLDAAPLAGDDLPPFLPAAYRATQQAAPAPGRADANEPAIGEPVADHRVDAPVATVAALAAPGVAAESVAELGPEPELSPAPGAVAAAAPVRRDPVLPRVPLASLAVAAPQVPIGEAPLGSLGLVQLIERLAQAIAVRQTHRAHDRDRLDAAPAAALAPHPAATHPAATLSAVAVIDPQMPLHRFDPLSMDPAGPLLRAKPQRAAEGDHPTITAIDAARRNDAADEAGSDEYECVDAAADQALLPDTAGSEDDISPVEHRYSSLADMAMPRPDLVPAALVDLPVLPAAPVADHAAPVAEAAAGPVVPFRLTATRPQSGARMAPDVAQDAADADAGDADRALREALATLRRMSGQR